MEISGDDADFLVMIKRPDKRVVNKNDQVNEEFIDMFRMVWIRET